MAATADAEWKGDLKGGAGTMRLGSGSYEGDFTYHSRFEDGEGSNPEELIGAAFAGCFSMALSNMLASAGSPPDSVRTSAVVKMGTVGEGRGISRIELVTVGSVPGMDEATFKEHAQKAKAGCPVGKALASVPEVTLDASLQG
jgi:lipoyl-dependent peroxiredoxin